MKIDKNKLYKIKYTKIEEKKNVVLNTFESERSIIPLVDVPDLITALDVTDISDEDIVELLVKINEYQEYVKNYMNTMFNFKTWYEHIENKELDSKLQEYRRFKLSNLTII